MEEVTSELRLGRYNSDGHVTGWDWSRYQARQTVFKASGAPEEYIGS